VIPLDLLCTCELCGVEVVGLENMVSHLDAVHDLQAQRWPDGGLVIDASDTPELMEER